MQMMLAALALILSGASQAAPTTFYFSGTANLHRVIDPSTNTWADGGVGQAFSGAITVDGWNGTLTTVLGMSADVQSMQRITSSRCGLLSNFQCSGEPSAPTNFLGFTLNFGGAVYGSWSAPGADEVEHSSVTKLRWATGSSYTAAGGVSRESLVPTTQGGQRRLSSWTALGLTLEGGFGAVADPYEPGEFPDLSHIAPALSELRFNTGAFTCALVDDACQDTVFDPESVTLIGRLNYIGLAPEIVAEIPEPATAVLVLAGMVGLLGARSRSRSRIRRSAIEQGD